MPYNIKRGRGCPAGKPWGLYKIATGEKVACHTSRAKADAQRRAIMASERKENGTGYEIKALKKDSGDVVYGIFEVGSDEAIAWHPTKEEAEARLVSLDDDAVTKSMAYVIGWDVVTFEQAEEAMRVAEDRRQLSELNWTFKSLMDNVMQSPDIGNKPAAIKGLVDEYVGRLQGTDGDLELYKEFTKTENGKSHPAADYAYVPDPFKPSTWKLRLTDSSGKVTVGQLGRAAAALSPGGFRGQKAKIPSGELPKVKRRIQREYKKLGVKGTDLPTSVKGKESFFDVWKEDSGTYRWVAVYSNDREDEDSPPETIVSKSHQAFTLLANEGVVDMPELWHWHVPFSRYGVADYLDYYGGFALATGTIDEGMEHVAQGVMKSKTPLKVSHGMPVKYIMRDPEDASKIVFHVSKEISTLPADRAANPGTGFLMLKAKETGKMDITKEVSASMLEMGYTNTEIDEIASRLGVRRKDKDELHTKNDDDDGANAAVPDKLQEDNSSDDSGSADADVPDVSGTEGVTAELKEVFDSASTEISTAVKSFKEGMEAALREATQAAGDLKAIRDLQVATLKANTPAESMDALKSMSAVGASSAKLDGRSSLAKDAPKETDSGNGSNVFGIPFLDNAIAGMNANSGAQEGR